MSRPIPLGDPGPTGVPDDPIGDPGPVGVEPSEDKATMCCHGDAQFPTYYEGAHCSKCGAPLSISTTGSGFCLKCQALPTTPVATDAITFEDFVREQSWNATNIRYNPYAYFQRYARAHGLLVPLTQEFDVEWDKKKYRVQGFAGAIVFAEVDKWETTAHIMW